MKSKYKYLGLFIFLVLLIVGYLVYKKNENTFSVIVPVYNSEEYLAKCLDSIITQEGNFELILVNDGSTDNSLKIMQEYAKNYKNIVLINQENQGVSVARNQGIKAAKNKYVTFIDSDDWLEPGAFKRVLNKLDSDSPDMLLTGFYDVYDKKWVEATRGIEAAKNAPEENKYRNTGLEKLSLYSPFYANGVNDELYYYIGGVRALFFSKDFLEKNNLLFTKGVRSGQDGIFVYQSFYYNPLISILSTPIYNYRNRVDSASKSVNLIKERYDYSLLLQSTREYKNSSRRVQLLIDDSWLLGTIVGIANIMRHHQELDNIEYGYKIYNNFSKYSKEELNSCINLKTLHDLLYGK